MTEDYQKENSMDNWKQFQGTELGSLLGSIYGSKSSIKINYPKPKQQSAPVEKKEFIPGGAKLEAVDPRKSTRRSVNINVPKPNGRNSSYDEEFSLKAIDVIPKRKSADTIKVELDDIKMRQERYRPAHVKPISSDAEKERLNQIFTFKGGKGLPEELTHPVGETPLEMSQRMKEKERLDSIRQKRGLMVVRQDSHKSVLSYNEELAEQISREIEERTQYLDEMKGLGLSADKERQLRQEISSKANELKRIHDMI